jgi:hypothetical protein
MTKVGLEDDHMRDHRIVGRICVFGNVEIFLDDTPRVRKEGPVSANSTAKLIRLGDIVSADRDKPAIADLELAMEFGEALMLSAVLGTVASTAEDENHRVLSLQL